MSFCKTIKTKKKPYVKFLGTLLQIGSGCRPKIEGLIQPGLHPAHQEDWRFHHGFLPG